MGNATAHDYDLTNLAKNVTNFHFVRSLLIHGMADGEFINCNTLSISSSFPDNVHFQNAAELISAFVRENIHFNLMVCFLFFLFNSLVSRFIPMKCTASKESDPTFSIL
jgi:hypothetical protein